MTFTCADMLGNLVSGWASEEHSTFWPWKTFWVLKQCVWAHFPAARWITIQWLALLSCAPHFGDVWICLYYLKGWKRFFIHHYHQCPNPPITHNLLSFLGLGAGVAIPTPKVSHLWQHVIATVVALPDSGVSSRLVHHYCQMAVAICQTRPSSETVLKVKINRERPELVLPKGNFIADHVKVKIGFNWEIAATVCRLIACLFFLCFRSWCTPKTWCRR